MVVKQMLVGHLHREELAGEPRAVGDLQLVERPWTVQVVGRVGVVV